MTHPIKFVSKIKNSIIISKIIVLGANAMNHFIDAYKNYATFSGRANRPQYWYFVLFYIIVSFLLALIDLFLGTAGEIADTGFFGGLFALASFVPTIAIAARRLHDTGRSGWWQLIILIPIIGFIVLVFFLASKGNEGENKYGIKPATD